jgi:phenylalanyl-tRNA synthetase beta chain
VESAALFELGTVFAGIGATATDRVDERPALAFGATGMLRGANLDFFAVKGLVEAVVQRFQARVVYFDRFAPELGLMPGWLHPGRSARVVADGATLGFFGQLHPELAAARKLRQPVFLGELQVPRLLALGLRQPVPRELSRFQPVRRDFSFLLPDSVSYDTVAAAMGSLGIAELQQFEPAEVLRDPKGERVPAGEYSLLLRTVFQSAERTLRDEELQSWSQAVTGAVGSLGGRLRA